MGLCVFKTDEIKRCIEHTLASTTWNTETGVEPQPGVFFVHDQGVYLMSNGYPRDLLPGDKCYVAYAQDCCPEKDQDWWENSRALVGGDDFGETLPVNSKWLKNCDEYEEFHVNVTENELESYFSKPRRPIAGGMKT
jgi:hypothetical protein